MTNEEWRIEQLYRIHVYAGDRPVATFHTPADATEAVLQHNSSVRAQAWMDEHEPFVFEFDPDEPDT